MSCVNCPLLKKEGVEYKCSFHNKEVFNPKAAGCEENKRKEN